MTDRQPIKWPRQYAGDILAERSLDKRRELLEAVPAHLRAMVEFHVHHGWQREREAVAQ
ncbi:MAG: hypothetical protein AAGI72_15405 [Pseudomonadota bacterium]